MTRGEDFMKKRKCKNFHCSSMSNSAWRDLHGKGDTVKLHDIGQNLKSECQKEISFTPKKFQMEGAGFKNTKKKIFKGSQKASSSFLKPKINTLAPVIGMAVGAKSRNPQVDQATANILKSISGGRILNLTDLYGNGLGLRVMYIIPIKTSLKNEQL